MTEESSILFGFQRVGKKKLAHLLQKSQLSHSKTITISVIWADSTATEEAFEGV